MRTFPAFLLFLFLISFIGIVEAGDEDYLNSLFAENEGGVCVIPAGTYVIDSRLLVPDNIIIKAESDTKIKLTDYAGWKRDVGMFEFSGNGHNITISGFEIDGNEPKQTEDCGDLFYTIFKFDGGSDIEIFDMYLHDNCNDGIRIYNDELKEGNIKIHDNVFERCYHNAVYLSKVEHAEIYNNKIIPRTNSGCCITDSNHISIHDNTIDAGAHTGGDGLEIQKTSSIVMDDIEIYDNVISNTNLPGIRLYGYHNYPIDSAKNIYIHDNTISRCGEGRGTDRFYGGGLVIQGFDDVILENNLIDSCYNAGVIIGTVCFNPPDYVFSVTMKGNKISGTVAGRYLTGKDLIIDENYKVDNSGEWNPREEEPEDTDSNDNDYDENKDEEPEDTDSTDSEEETEKDTINSDITECLIHGFSFPLIEKDLGASVEVVYNNISYDPHSLIEVTGDDLKLIKFEYNGNTTRYFVDKDLWVGSIQHTGSELYLPGQFKAGSLQITVYSAEGYQRVTNVKIIENKLTGASSINPDLIIYISILAILGLSISRNIRRIFP